MTNDSYDWSEFYIISFEISCSLKEIKIDILLSQEQLQGGSAFHSDSFPTLIQTYTPPGFKQAYTLML